MRWQLDDNERGAFNYLFGGVVLVLAVRLVFYAIDRSGGAPPADAEGLEAFQHGYFLGQDGMPVVATTAGRMERIAFAALFSLGTSALAAGLVALFARGRAAMGVGRTVLVLVLGWSVYAALFVPVRSSRSDGQVLVTRTYGIAVRDIPLPFTATERRSSLADVARIEAVNTNPVHGCDGSVVLQRVDHVGTATLLAARTGLCLERQLEALRQASGVAATLERALH